MRFDVQALHLADKKEWLSVDGQHNSERSIEVLAKGVAFLKGIWEAELSTTPSINHLRSYVDLFADKISLQGPPKKSNCDQKIQYLSSLTDLKASTSPKHNFRASRPKTVIVVNKGYSPGKSPRSPSKLNEIPRSTQPGLFAHDQMVKIDDASKSAATFQSDNSISTGPNARQKISPRLFISTLH